MTERMSVSMADDGQGGVTARVSGEIDLSNADQLRQALDAGGHLTVDLSGVTYMDSAAIAVLFARAAEGPLEVRCRPDSVVAALIDITRLGDVAAVRED